MDRRDLLATTFLLSVFLSLALLLGNTGVTGHAVADMCDGSCLGLDTGEAGACNGAACGGGAPGAPIEGSRAAFGPFAGRLPLVLGALCAGLLVIYTLIRHPDELRFG